MSSQTELRTQIAHQIVDAVTSGGLPPWRQPWKADRNCGNRERLDPFNGLMLTATPITRFAFLCIAPVAVSPWASRRTGSRGCRSGHDG